MRAVWVGAVLIWTMASNLEAAVTRYYRFETNNGTTASDGQVITAADDSSGNSLPGAPVGDPTFAATPSVGPVPATGAANAFAYLGGVGKGITLDATTAQILAPTFTVEALFRLSTIDPSTSDARTILRVRGAGGFPFELGLLNLEGVSGNGTNDLLFLMSNDTLELRRFDLQVNTNYHVAATFDGTIARLYVDGLLVDSSSFSGFTGSGMTPGGIGYDPWIASRSYLEGWVDELRISDVALAPSQFLNAVPEPTGFALIVVAIARLAARRRSHSVTHH